MVSFKGGRGSHCNSKKKREKQTGTSISRIVKNIKVWKELLKDKTQTTPFRCFSG